MTSKKRTVSEIMKTEKAAEVEEKSKEIAQWIEAQLQEKLPKANLREALLDGVVLCKLINALCPSALKRFHKKPRMLAMKIENIGFFLATCKTRMNLPPALLFQPTDIHDDSNNLASMSKVLNVLSFLKGDGEGDMIAALPDEEDEDAPVEGDTVEPPEPEPEPPEPEPETVAEPEPPAVVAKVVYAVVKETVTTTSSTTSVSHQPAAAASTYRVSSSNGSDDDYLAVQSEVLKVITDAINTELSIESKKKLIRTLQQQVSSFEDKVISSNEDQLVALAKAVGLDDVSKSKGREEIVESLLKYGRIQ